ncbi:MAG: molybdopterin-dependent oxidoreductase [Myxococcales bacterium]|nr:molybdopterin-dependent oxidoreductase [Myxococcales bacterium]
MTATVHRSFCRLCTAACGTLVTTEGDTVLEVSGDPAHPISRGYLCRKGEAAAQLHDRPDRLDYPMLRRDGRLARVPWDGLLDHLASRLSSILRVHGPDAIGLYQGTASFYDSGSLLVPAMFLRLLRTKSKYSTATIDMPNKLLVPELMCGRPVLFPCVDHEAVSLLVYWGTNPVVSHGHFNQLPDPVRRIDAVRRRGEVWVIDTQRTQTAQLASRHLAPRAGTDYALLAYLLREVLRDGSDLAYLEAHAAGVEQLARSVERFGLEEAAEITGLPPSDLTDFLAAIRRHRHVVIETGTGTTMAAAANVTEWLKWSLEIVTGSTSAGGGRWFHPGWLTPLDATRPPSKGEPGPGPRSRPELPRRWDQYPCAALADEIEAGNLRALLVLGGNPAVAIPQPGRVSRALKSLEVLAVWDILPTATTECATHLLPSVDPFERADLITVTAAAQPAVFTQHTRAVVPPRGQRRATWWSFGHLGRLMGMDPMPRGLDPDQATDDDLLGAMTGLSRVPFEGVRAAQGPVILSGADYDWVHRYLLPEGRWRLAPRPLVEQLQAIRPPSGLVLQNRRQPGHTNSLFVDPEGPRRDQPLVHIHPADAAEAGIRGGEVVRVASPHGSLLGVALVDEDIRRGAVSIPHGHAGTNVQQLTSPREGIDPLTGMVLHVGVPLSLEPAAPPGRSPAGSGALTSTKG